MLIDEPQLLNPCADQSLASLFAFIDGPGQGAKRLQTGVYQTGFNSSHLLPSGAYEKYPELSDLVDDWVNAFGVCDSVENLLEALPVLQHPTRQFVVTLTPVYRADQPRDGGWRWHKWGPYIGAKDPQHEYLYDEDGIDVVYCYHVFEKKDPA